MGRHCALDFRTIPPTINLNDSNKNNTLAITNTSICDRNGEPIFYTNALRVFNKKGQIMPNGSGIDSGTYSTTYATSGAYNPLFKGAVTVPFPNDSNKFYVFYLNMEWNVDGGYSPEKLYYLIVDRTLNGGLGDVTIKEQIVLSGDTLSESDVLAVKHGNGKDWWIIVRKYKSNKYYRILIDSAGVHNQSTQTIGNEFNYNLAISGVGSVSQQGNKICYLFNDLNIQHFQMDLFDFDRCSGLLSNYQTIYQINTSDTLVWSSSCFSPSGRFLYVNDGLRIWQLDLSSSNILNSKILVGVNTIQYRLFFKMEIAPDNKIYVSPYGGYEYMSVINKPDSFGLACNFVENAIQFGNHTTGPWTDGGLPNTPNFALGKLNCPTGIEEQVINNEAIRVYPNPTEEKLTVSSYQLLGNTKVEVIDVLGRNVFAKQYINSKSQEIQLDVSCYTKGIYVLKVTNEKGNVMTKQFVKE